MPPWEWFLIVIVANPFALWLLFIMAVVLSIPVLNRIRTWQTKHRFIAHEGSKLQNPQNADARFQLANIYADGRSWRRAEEYAREAVKTAEENPLYEGKVPYHFLRLLGEALYHRGRYNEAITTYEQALKAPSELGHTEARFGMGKAHYGRGDFEKASACFQATLQENTSHLEAYFRTAQTACRLGRGEEAAGILEEFRRVARSLPQFAGKRRLRWRLAVAFFTITRGRL